MELLAFDTETHLFGLGNVIPQIVCCSRAFQDGAEVAGDLSAVYDKDLLNGNLSMMFNGSTEGYIKVAHNAAFDLGVIFRQCPELITGIFDEIAAGRVHCTIIREKLLNLSTQGDLKFVRFQGSMKKKVDYHLGGFAKQYLNIDMEDVKQGEDAWRTNYSALEDKPVSEWPEDAIDYALNDAKYLIPIWHRQEERRQLLMTDRGIDPFITLPFRVGVDFCLKLMSAWGISVDPAKKAEVEAEIALELTPEKLNHLMDAGILRPAVPGEPYKNGAKNEDGTPKLKKSKPESIDTKKLKAHVVKLAETLEDITLKTTKPSDRHPEGQLSIDAEWLEEHWHLDPVLEQFYNRAKLQKMVTVEIPRMNWNGVTSPIVHPHYDVLKETGRTSSYASKGYPSFNCQNVAPRARACYVARDGTLLLSTDYNQMELGTTAQKCYELFGSSVMRDKINEGVDLHAYLGSQLALHLEETFAESCAEEGADTPEKVYAAFIKLESSEHEAVRAFFKKYRTFAKPTGLGYPGGLGPATFIQYAKATYGLVITKDMAVALRNIWRNTFPEMADYHKWVNTSCEDPHNTDSHGKNLYAYRTPMGMYRAGCTYCAVANGAALQSPSAEGALLGVFNIVRACYDPTMNSILYGVFRPIMFIHDEIVGELPDVEPEAVNEYVLEVESIMIEAMRAATPDVEPRCESVLMRRWDKFANPTRDAEGRLVVTEEKGVPNVETVATPELEAEVVAG